MRKAGWIRTGIVFGATTAVVAGTTLGIIYGLGDAKLSHKVIRRVKNSVKTQAWYEADGSVGYGNPTTVNQKMTVPTLLRVGYLGNDEYQHNNNSWAQTNYSIPVSRLDLADYVLLKDDKGHYIGFDKTGTKKTIDPKGYAALKTEAEKKEFQYDDEIKSYDTSKGPNSVIPGDRSLVNLQYPKWGSTFLKAAKLAVGGFELHIREGVHWVDNKGKSTKYLLKPEDFQLSIIRSALGGSATRLMPASSSNPFGGFGSKRGYPLSKEDIKNGKTTDKDVVDFQDVLGREANALSTSMGNKENLPNDYLFGLYGYRGLKEIGLPPINAGSNSPFTISSNNQKIVNLSQTPFLKNASTNNTVSFEPVQRTPGAKVDHILTQSNLKGLLTVLLSNSMALSPAPSEYIENEITNRDLITSRGTHIKVPNGLAKAAGFGVYASTLDLSLTVAPMYVAESSTNRIKYKKNMHFYNQDWVKSKNSMDEWIEDYVLQPDKTLFGQSELAAFSNQRTSSLTLIDQPKNKLLKLQQRKDVIFSKGSESISSIGYILPNVSPFGKTENSYNFNDEFSKLVYGATRKELTSGQAKTILSFTSPESIEFRSLISAAINWFSLAKELYPDNSKISWLLSTPPNMKINPNGTNKTEEFTDKITTVNKTKAFGTVNGKFDEIKTPNGKSLGDWEESKAWFINKSSDSDVAMKSPGFALIKKQMKTLLDKHVKTGQVAFEIRNYWSNFTSFKTGLEAAAKVINSIYPEKLRVGNLNDPKSRGVTFKIYTDAADRNAHFGKSSNVIGGGWGADYQGFGTMMTYFDTYGSVALSASIKQKANSTNPEYKKLFPGLIAYATIFEDEYQKFYNKQTADIKKGLYPNVESIIQNTNSKKGGLRFFEAIKKPNWKTIITDPQKQKDFELFFNNKLVPFNSIVDRQIQIKAVSKTKANPNSPYKIFSTNEGVVKVLRELKDIIGTSVESRAIIADPTTPTARLVQSYLQIPIDGARLYSPLDVLVDASASDRRTQTWWLNYRKK